MNISLKTKEASLIIPVEGQVRELDAKLLLACVAANHGFSSVIGPRKEINFRLSSFQRGIYLSKSMRSGSDKVFRILRKLGHEIVAWDEDALVHLPADTYFSRRISPVAIQYVSHLLAWGQENADLWEQHDRFPRGIPIHVTGNCRGDLLRPEMRPYFKKEVEQIRDTYGDFILVNTNFNHVNAFYPNRNLFQPVMRAGEMAVFGRAAKGMTREFAEGFEKHKKALFESFQELIPALDREFADYTIVVRPHPVEKHDVYKKLAERCKKVRVTNEGNIVPWLIGANALIHNGCTTGVEAYAMDVPAISYRPVVNDYYDDGFYRLPNRLSHQCFGLQELKTKLGKILAGELGAVDDAESKFMFNHHLAAQEGPLASERIVEVLAKIMEGRHKPSKPALRHRLQGLLMSFWRSRKKRLRSSAKNSHNRPEFLQHRYPGISLEELSDRLQRFQQLIGATAHLKVTCIADQVFRISP
jgi:surface carbohydrate biosynthesis protein